MQGVLCFDGLVNLQPTTPPGATLGGYFLAPACHFCGHQDVYLLMVLQLSIERKWGADFKYPTKTSGSVTIPVHSSIYGRPVQLKILTSTIYRGHSLFALGEPYLTNIPSCSPAASNRSLFILIQNDGMKFYPEFCMLIIRSPAALRVSSFFGNANRTHLVP